MLPFHRVVSDDFDSVNQLILAQVHSNVDLVEDIGQYLIDAGGKRLRPLLVLLVANSLSYQGNQQHTLAAIIEFIHSATLLHDDVVDTSNMRRGRLTANAKWGNAPSVLVGDFLYSRAFQMMVSIGNMEIMAILSDTTNVISEGEVQQLINAGDPDVSEDNYTTVIYKKTAALFEAACTTAAVLCQADITLKADLKAYGYHLGMAFQLIDDVLDYQGDSDQLGKNVGDDLAEGKPTLPLIYAMQHAAADDAQFIRQCIKEPILDTEAASLDRIINIVNDTGAIDYSQRKAAEHVAAAKAMLAKLDSSIYKSALFDLADFSIARHT